MFAKLLKHEWRASRGVLGVLTLCVMGMGLVGALLIRGLNSFDYEAMEANPMLSLVLAGMSTALGLGVLALAVYAVAVAVILLYRFYKNKFTDEGYLTFTLPVKAEQIYWASALNILIWSVISAVAVAAAVLLAVGIGAGDLSALYEMCVDFLELYTELFELLQLEPLTAVLAVLTGLASAALGLALPLACITGGAVLAKKHKILAAFGVYYVVNMIISTVSGVISALPAVLLVTAETAEAMTLYTNFSMGLSLLLTAALAVAAYCITIHLMKHRLNLP